MKKNVPSGYFSKLLFLLAFVAFFATNNVQAQVCDGSNALPNIVCVNGDLIWINKTLGGTVGQPITWTITDGTGGAHFTDPGSTGLTYHTVLGPLNNDPIPHSVNTAHITLGPILGTITVTMSYDNVPGNRSCSSSLAAKIVVVTATPTEQKCYNDKGCIQAAAQTIVDNAGAFTIPPYTFTLVETGATNETGLFCDLDPGIYHVTAADRDGCPSKAFEVNLVNPPYNPVHVTCPGDKHVRACDYTQAQIDQMFADWVLLFQYSGGTQPIERRLIGGDVAPKLCNGSQLVRLEVTDYCKTFDACQATFYIDAPDPVNLVRPLDRDVKACDLLDYDILKAKILAFEAEFDVTGGCDPQITWDPYINPQTLCEGTINLVGHIVDKCYDSTPILAHLTILPPSIVNYQTPAEDVKPPCYYKDQLAIEAAYIEWLKGFKVDKTTGCDPQIQVDNVPAPPYCGGVITVKAYVVDRCALQKEVSAKFGVQDSPKPVIDECPAGRDLGCNPDVIPGAGTPKVTSLCEYTVVPTITDSHTDCFYKRVIKYVVSTDCWKDADSCEQTYTWKQDKEGPIITGLEDKTVPGGDEDNGLCTPTTTIGGKSFTPPSFKSNSPVSFDFGQVRTGDAPDEKISWTNGTTTAQSEYLEGQCVPQRLLMSGLKKGKHTLYIRHEAVKKQDASRHAYDFLTGWDNAIKTGEAIGTSGRSLLKNLNAQECDGNWSGAGQAACKAFTTSAKTDIPDVMGNPPNQTGIRNVDDNITCFEGLYGNRQMEMEANSAVSGFAVRFLGYDGSDTKSDYAWYAIDWTSDSSIVELKFAGRMAMGGGSCGYGNCHGAGSVKGNPYHIIIEGLDGGNAGQRDNQTKCKRSQTCDVNIPVKFDTPKATDCDPAVVTPTVVAGKEDVITVLPDGSVRHCRTWEAYDACLNRSEKTQCITVVCVLGANFGERTLGYVAPTSKSIYDTIGKEDIAITKFVAYPNPFRSSVSLDLQTNSSERVNLSVYDMLGKQLDQRVTTPGEINELKLGETYPTGMYNLILNQATEQRTIRLLKQ